mgnify:CR=1 FL=1
MTSLLLINAVFTFTATARRIREGDPVKIDFDPALKGGIPSISIEPLEKGEDFNGEIIIYFYAWEGKEIPLETRTISGKEKFSMKLPTRGKEDILGVRVEIKKTPDAKAEKVCDWRAMYFPEGKAIDYTGSPDLWKPEDFDQYWNEAKTKLSWVDPEPQFKLVPKKETETGRLYRVIINSYWNLPIVCWYYVPKDVDPLHPESIKKKYPAIQIMPGWGAEEPPQDRTAEGYITLSVNPKSHGPSQKYFKTPIDHHLWNIDIPEDYYYRAAFMDCIRGIDFLCSRPEVDAERIGVEGGSQGGAFALAMGGLDQRVSCVAANVPYIVNFPDFSRVSTLGSGYIYMKLAEGPHKGKRVSEKWNSVDQFNRKNQGTDKGARIRKTLGYVDIANHVTNISVPTLVCVGRQDPVCPPINGIVAINRISEDVPKKLFIDKEAEHENSALMRKQQRSWFEQHLKN